MNSPPRNLRTFAEPLLEHGPGRADDPLDAPRWLEALAAAAHQQCSRSCSSRSSTGQTSSVSQAASFGSSPRLNSRNPNAARIWTRCRSIVRPDHASSLRPGLTTVPLHGVDPSHVVLATRASDHSHLVAAFRKSAQAHLTGPGPTTDLSEDLLV